MTGETCPFCPHERHDDSDCYGRASNNKQCECCGPTEAERAAIDAPSKIVSWLYEVLEAETWGSSARTDVGVTEVSANDESLEIDTKFGRFRLKIEKVHS